MSTFELCVGCGSVLPADHGFANMCDTCNPDKIDIEVLVPPVKEVLRAPKVYPFEKPARKPRRVKVSDTPNVVAHVTAPDVDIDLGIDENASYDELFKLKAENLDELAATKIKLGAGRLSASDYAPLKAKILLLGRKDQTLAALLKTRKRPKSLPTSGQEHKDFLGRFFESAKIALSPEIFDIICRISNTEQQ